MASPSHLTIMGGGISGLATGFYARKAGIPFTIFESGDRIGGNCVTWKHGDFLFDSGAHRFHDKDHEITEELRGLMGDELKPVSTPSFIFCEGRFVRFPLSPLNLIPNLGWGTSSRAGLSLIRSRIGGRRKVRNFREFALRSFGKTLSELFLFNYSLKLWGLPPERLSVDIGGTRLRRLNLKTVLFDFFSGGKNRSGHLEGAFFYPESGIGRIADKLEERCGEGAVRLNSPVERILHDGSRVRGIVLKGGKRIRVDFLVNTLPLNRVLEMLDPAPPAAILSSGKALRFRNVVMIVFFLSRENVTHAASIYFPDSRFAFTRVFEPKNRSKAMAPPDRTALVAEIPCHEGDPVWSADESVLIELTQEQLREAGFFHRGDVLDATSRRLKDAYPVLEVGADAAARHIVDYLRSFVNVKTIGRGGRFAYVHIHDLLRSAKSVVSETWVEWK